MSDTVNYMYLPRLNQEPGITVPNDEKSWEQQEDMVLEQMSNRIDVDESAKLRGVSSIPDVWARPLLFKMALENPKHPLHKQMVQEWRGLISILILKNILESYQLDIIPIKLNSDTKIGAALLDLEPDKGHGGLDVGQGGKRYKWSEISIILFEGKPIGATSPATLVFTGTEFNENLLSEFHHKGVRVDPGTHRLLEPIDKDQRIAIKIWLDYLFSDDKTRLRNLFNTESAGKIIFDQFESWYKDLENDVSTERSKYEVDTQDSLFQSSTGIFLEVFRPIKYKPGVLDFRSDMFISNASYNYQGIKYDNLIAITGETLDLGGGHATVYRQLKAGSVKGTYQSLKASSFEQGQELNGVPLVQGVAWIRPELFFLSDKLVMIDRGLGDDDSLLYNGLVIEQNTEGQAARTTRDPKKDVADRNVDGKYILPLKPELLNSLNISESADLVSLDPKYTPIGDDVKFSMKIPISYNNGTIKVKIERIYKEKPEHDDEGQLIIIDKAPPNVELWPDFKSDHWNQYYIFSDSDEFEFIPYSNATEERPIIKKRETDWGDQVQITKSPFYPQIILCKYKDENSGNFESVGAIFLESESAPKPTSSWLAGIDFGTSNTNIWYKEMGSQGKKPQQLELAIVPKQIMNSAPETRTRILRDAFIPDKPPQIPFLTALRVLDKTELQNTESQIFTNYAIHFIDDARALGRHTHTNLKWGANESFLAAFLDHTMVVIAAQAIQAGVSHLDINISYPISMDAGTVNQMLTSWRNASKKVVDVFDGEPVLVNGNLDWEEMAKYTESITAGKYFGSQHFGERLNIDTGGVVIDVGGGTSDICIWEDKQIKYQTSIILAGNNIAECFEKSKGLCNTIFYGLDAKEPDLLVNQLEQRRSSKTVFDAALNLYLRKYSEEIRLRLPRLRTDPYFKVLTQILLVTFGSIVFYIGMAINSLRERDKLPQTADEFEIGWAGNASGFLKWVDFGDDQGMIMRAILKNVLDSFEIKNTENRVTSRPKSEAACGLILDEKIEGEIQQGEIIGGENIRLEVACFKTTDYKKFLVDFPQAKDVLEKVATPKSENRQSEGYVYIDIRELKQEDKEKLDDEVMKRLEEKMQITYDQPLSNNHIRHFDMNHYEVGEKIQEFVKVLNSALNKFGYDRIKLEKYGKLKNVINTKLRDIKRDLPPPEDDGENDNGPQKLAKNVEPVFIIEVKELITQMIDNLTTK